MLAAATSGPLLLSRRGVDGDYHWSPSILERPRSLAGTYYWQAGADAYNSDGTWAGTSYGPVRVLRVRMPRAWLERRRIPAMFGKAGRGTMFVSRRGIPRSVRRARFYWLVRVSAWRWGFRFGGTTHRRPGSRDGRNVVGFRRLSAYLPPALGQAEHWGGEHDLRLSTRFRWFAGPGYPPFNRIDVETVLLHELGHAAGNR